MRQIDLTLRVPYGCDFLLVLLTLALGCLFLLVLLPVVFLDVVLAIIPQRKK